MIGFQRSRFPVPVAPEIIPCLLETKTDSSADARGEERRESSTRIC